MPSPFARHHSFRSAFIPRLTEQPDITYIVSAFNRPAMLPVALWSIKGQSHQDFECIVADNADYEPTAQSHKRMVEQLSDSRFTYARTAGKTRVSDCYWAAEYIVRTYECGRWLCFPCDDTYLMPEFGQRMLLQAFKTGAQFVYCEHIIAGPEALGGPGTAYAVWTQRLHRTAKTSFIVKRAVFEKVGGFQGKMDRASTVNADYFFSTQMAQAGVKIASVSDVMVVHN